MRALALEPSPRRCFRRAGVALVIFLLTASTMLGTPLPSNRGASAVQMDDWSQWRGPARDGVATGMNLPQAWPAELQREWQVEVGAGYSSPVVAGDRVFTFSRQGEREIVRAIDLADGSTIYETSYDAPYRVNRAAASHGSGPKSTPVLVDGRICTLGISGIVSCIAADSGDLLWQNDFSDEFRSTAPIYGAAMSPAVIDGSLIVHVGGGGDGALMALDPATGTERWRWDGGGPGYASPILVELGGRRQIVTQSARHIISVTPDDGGLLWQIPLRTPYDQNIVTPLLLGDRLVFSGLEAATFAVEPVVSEGSWATPEVWSNDRLPMYMSSPVLVGERLVGFSSMRRGQFFCLDSSNGEAIWTSEGRRGENAALVAADALVLALTSAAQLFVIDPTAPEFRPLARYTVAESTTFAHPVPVNGGLLIKDSSTLALWRW